MNPLTIRWKIVPSKNPWRASFLKFSIVFGAASVQNCTTISPSLVLITATSFEEFIDLFSSARMVAMTSADPTKKEEQCQFHSADPSVQRLMLNPAWQLAATRADEIVDA